MSSYGRREGHVEIETHDLAARCSRCHKSLMYPKGMRLGWWKRMLQAFIKKHRDCTAS